MRKVEPRRARERSRRARIKDEVPRSERIDGGRDDLGFGAGRRVAGVVAHHGVSGPHEVAHRLQHAAIRRRKVALDPPHPARRPAAAGVALGERGESLGAMHDDDVRRARYLGRRLDAALAPRGEVLGRAGLAATQRVAHGARGGVGAVVTRHGEPAHVEPRVAQ